MGEILTPGIVTVTVALPANICPLCGRNHREKSAPLAKCAKRLEELGYLGYDYDTERWIVRY